MKAPKEWSQRPDPCGHAKNFEDGIACLRLKMKVSFVKNLRIKGALFNVNNDFAATVAHRSNCVFLGSITCPGSMGMISAFYSTPLRRCEDRGKFDNLKMKQCENVAMERFENLKI